MAASFGKLVCQDDLLVGDARPGIPLFQSFHARGSPTIMERKFISLEYPFDTSEIRARMFITLDGPPGDGEGIAVLIKYNTPVGVAPAISCPMGIPPKPPDVVVVSTTSPHGDHC